MPSIDLNADLAEHNTPTNVAMAAKVSSANISCGVHAGDPLLTYRTIERARRNGVVVGAHPSYPDRENFGRTSMMLGTDPRMIEAELRTVLRAQLASFASLNDGEIAYVKPHGALYNDAQIDSTIAHIVAAEAARHDAALMGQPGSQLQVAADEYGVRYLSEVFADRGYDHAGRLVRRGQPKSMLTSPAFIARRVVRMVAEGTVETWGYDHDAKGPARGTYTFPAVDSVCVHGDTDGAYNIVLAIRVALADAGITIASPLAVAA